MHTEYRFLLLLADEDPAVRCIVVTGAGSSFCVGADTTALEGHASRGSYASGTDPSSLARPGFGVMPEFDADFAYHFGVGKPIICAVNGPCAGVGLVLACYCDIRFALEGATMTAAHGKLNLPAEYGLSWLLPRIVGLTKANDLLLSSRKFNGREALEMGLVNAAFPNTEELMQRTYDYARGMVAAVAPGSLRETKRQIYADQHRGVAASVKEAGRLMERMMGEADYKEGLRALLEKRKPRWGLAPVRWGKL